MSKPLLTISDLFDEFGGPSAVAKALGRGQSTASEMKRRGSIPVEHWPMLIQSEKGRDLGLTSDLLVSIHTRGAQAAA